jgi:WavE lipopolysaccharide synthesis
MLQFESTTGGESGKQVRSIYNGMVDKLPSAQLLRQIRLIKLILNLVRKVNSLAKTTSEGLLESIYFHFYSRIVGLDRIEILLSALEKREGVFLTYRVRNISNFQTASRGGLPTSVERQLLLPPTAINGPSYSSERIAIVVQGPINHNNRFTFHVVKRYLAVFPDSHIILSTWANEFLDDFNEFLDFPNFHIVLSDLPETRGIVNINLQITSTQAGLRMADELGTYWVIKTRTDQCIMNPRALGILLSTYKHHQDLYGLRNPVIAVSHNSFLFRMYGVSDMFQFSDIKTLTTYWSCPLDSRESKDIRPLIAKTMREQSLQNIGETYINRAYLQFMGEKIENTFAHSLHCLTKYYVIVNSQEIDIVWGKYTKNEDMWAASFWPTKYSEITHWDWLLAKKNPSIFDEYLNILDSEVGI